MFRFGYEQGKTFLDAWSAEKIDLRDLNEVVPIQVRWFRGPTHDFILGRIFQEAQDDASEKLYPVRDTWNTAEEFNEMKELIAANQYRESNCILIGQ